MHYSHCDLKNPQNQENVLITSLKHLLLPMEGFTPLLELDHDAYEEFHDQNVLIRLLNQLLGLRKFLNNQSEKGNES